MTNQAKASILTVVAVILWGTAASAFKIALLYVTPFILLLYSALVSTVALLVILSFQGKLADVLRLPPKSWALAALLGFINPFCYYLVLFEAYAVLPGQIAMSLNYGWPFALTVLSVPLLKQKLTRVQLVSIGVSFLGAVVIATKGQFLSFGEVSTFGVILAISSTLLWAVFWLLSARDRVDPVVKLFVGFVFGLLYIVVCSPIFGGIHLPTPVAAVPLVYIGLFEMGITFVLWLTALQLSSSTVRIGNLVYISPFLSLLFLHLVVGEEIHLTTFIGLLLIVGSIIFQETRTKTTGIA